MSAFDSLFTNDSFLDVFKSTITYSRDSEDDIIITEAMDSIISTEQQLEFGSSLITQAREWQIKVEDISDLGEPERGDTITNAAGLIYEVCNIGSASNWEYDVDPAWFRIRTQLIGS